MKSVRKFYASLPCLVLPLCLAPLAWAEDRAVYETHIYDRNVIVGVRYYPDGTVVY